MSPAVDHSVSPADLALARAQVRAGTRGLFAGLEAVLGVAGAAGGAATAAITGHDLVELAVSTGLGTMLVGSPIVGGIYFLARRRGLAIGIENARQSRLMQVEATRRAFENQLAGGLEMAEDEPAAFDVIRRAVAATVPDATVELLLADNSQAHLDRAVTAIPDGPDAVPGCPVEAPNRCVAARRAHTLVFPDSENLDACPMLRSREGHRCAAVCVPVSIMGRTVGITHAARPVDRPFDDEEIQGLQSIANQSGNRLGVLRIMSETHLQASTDGLTGLVNRRSFENHARRLRGEGTDFALVMADLDHFKDLNDTYGHEAGDRALRVFAQTVREAVRSSDVACRYGGEEFVLLLPGTDVPESIDVVERIRSLLVQATSRGQAPAFTASFGIAQSVDAESLDDLLQRADRALFAAKDAGRDCVCIDGHQRPIASLAAFS